MKQSSHSKSDRFIMRDLLAWKNKLAQSNENLDRLMKEAIKKHPDLMKEKEFEETG